MARVAVAAINTLSVLAAYYAWNRDASHPTLPTLSTLLQGRELLPRACLLIGFATSAMVAAIAVGPAGPVGIIASLVYAGAVVREPWHTLGALCGFACMVFTAWQLGAFGATAAAKQVAAVAVAAAGASAVAARSEAPLELGAILASSVLLIGVGQSRARSAL